MGEVGNPHGLAHGTMLQRDVAIVGRDFPSGYFLKRSAQFCVEVVEE
jgi:hypothetical protein